MEEKFRKQIASCETSLRRYTAVFSAVGYIKLAAAALLAVLAVAAVSKGFPAGICLACAAVILLSVPLWVYHAKVGEKVGCCKGVIAACQKYLDRIAGNWTDFSDTGGEFIDPEHPYACDLDIVGKKSLFQLLNVTNTPHGRQAFARDLLSARCDKDGLERRQEAVAELAEDIGFAADMQYRTSLIGIDSGAGEIVRQLKEKKTYIRSKFLRLCLTVFPVANVLFLIGVLALRTKNLYLPAVTLIFLQSLVWIAGMMKNAAFLGTIDRVPGRLDRYGGALKLLQGRAFRSRKLLELKARLTASGHSAAKAIRDLDGITKKLSARHNWLVYILLNIFLLWDYECCFMLSDWLEKYADEAESWFLALGEFESLLSLSVLPNVCAGVCLPEIADGGSRFRAEQMGHPLIANTARVCNSVEFGSNILIVSGSNMSGKTTFLRTVGINIVLANAGGFVCAEKLSLSLFSVMTSMRIADDLNEGVSTFYAELRRIKKIIDAAQNGVKLLFLIDEIFRGTNSVDRFYGAETVLFKLHGLGAAGIITTHDLELCGLADRYARIRNYSFSEHYGGGRILFDYRLREGKSQTTNAKYLMEMLGIL